MNKHLFIELCHPDAVLPEYARENDSGMDVYAPEEYKIYPGDTVVVKLGFKVVVPEGFELQVRPRSGMSLKTPIRVANSPGTIDAGYRGEVGVILQNTECNSLMPFIIKKGDRIAQIVLQEVPRIRWTKVENVVDIGKNRGGGFGHTGK